MSDDKVDNDGDDGGHGSSVIMSGRAFNQNAMHDTDGLPGSPHGQDSQTYAVPCSRDRLGPNSANGSAKRLSHVWHSGTTTRRGRKGPKERHVG